MSQHYEFNNIIQSEISLLFDNNNLFVWILAPVVFGRQFAKQLFLDLLRIKLGWALPKLQLIVNMELNSIRSMLYHVRKVLLFICVTTKFKILLTHY